MTGQEKPKRHSWEAITYKDKGGEIRTSFNQCKRPGCGLKKKSWYMRPTQYQFPGENVTQGKTPECRGKDEQLKIVPPGEAESLE